MYLAVGCELEVEGAGSVGLYVNAPVWGGERFLLACIPGYSACKWYMGRGYNSHRRQY
jgi:hypothetical protein